MKGTRSERASEVDDLPKPPNRGRGRSQVVDDLVNPMERFVGYKIRRLQHSIITELNELLSAFELRIMDFAILCVVEANPGMYQNGISRLLGAEPPAVVLALDRLEATRCVTRELSTVDKRLRTLRLTTSGSRLLRKVMIKVDLQEARFKGAAGKNLPAFVSSLDDMMRLYGLLD